MISPTTKMAGNITGEGGYECDFVSVPDDSLYCRICLSVARDPRQHGKCGQLYCHTCLEKYKEMSTSCPYCKENNADFFEDNRSHRQIQSLIVNCSYERGGCTWQGELRYLQDHYASKYTHAKVNCPLKCNTTMIKAMLDYHMKEECTNRLIKCGECGEEGPYWSITTDHKEKCLYMLEKCPTPGCDVEMCSLLMTFHLQTECEYFLVECKYRGVGCTAILTRRHMEEHENNDRYHLKLLAQSHTSLKEKYQQLEASNTSLQEKYKKLEISNTLQHEKYSKLEISHILLKENYRELVTLQRQQYEELEGSQLDRFKQMEVLQQERHRKLEVSNQELRTDMLKLITLLHSEWEESNLPTMARKITYTDLLNNTSIIWNATPQTYAFRAIFCRIYAVWFVVIEVIPGTNDHSLDWPFSGKVKVQILNPMKDDDHMTATVTITSQRRPGYMPAPLCFAPFTADIQKYKYKGDIYMKFTVISGLCRHWLKSQI